ncbi:CgeB family protein [Roseicella aquatilis]|uniref:Glycosyltransferase n=1 Tax=Roseicella aquatilis TaxID=2527868 RepID=A0A4R4DMF4_9PROT|nr:glycosyltransferase [Roseicella aquatilis]TCZ61328.1 glycosyltransferase [Roseicella aquatilis]
MRLAYFTHSLESCWNHGNAHFLRGVLRELQARGHDVAAHEPASCWSRENLLQDHGEGAFEAFRAAYPALPSHRYAGEEEIEAAVAGADVVLVHEWTEPWVVARIGRLRRAGGRFLLLFHDTHHRAVSDPEAIRRFDLADYDGVLAFGETLAQVYRRWGWGGRVFVWHEAADTRLFRPPAEEGARDGLVWIGNWGDGERTRELEAFLFRPARAAGLALDIHGVRYPAEALAMLDRHGARYRGWLPNAHAPEVFARHLATVHVPRRYYVELLPGIPTIRVFEALACGIPLLSAPWDDAEGLFTPGEDYLLARDGAEMERLMHAVRADAELRRHLAAHGLRTIRTRHSCAHRVEELLGILERLRAPAEASA